MRVSPRARRHEDRGGDPLDGLVNLFDLGIVLAVAFLIAALSSVDLTEVLTDAEAAAQAAQAADAITAAEDEVIREIEISPGEEVVGRGQEVGTVYLLEDGRTVIVRDAQAGELPDEGGVVPTPITPTTPPVTPTTPAPPPVEP